ncbi:hypothetical protein CYLTODRAFT_432999 [Cylindrobasidium torrendii FP15055 ss-10]|uniref:Uncharacterized protein n=1 Tax=Cylindrobasidium torrendii FP15055 ss-10 TaxID=1314674 RepID=A0A0D7AZL0_9AGAR|nr:hypothetical protein CYLTODRAFT_432999 [Cylindrobasidium torrendii FP15055 ss-10]
MSPPPPAAPPGLPEPQTRPNWRDHRPSYLSLESTDDKEDVKGFDPADLYDTLSYRNSTYTYNDTPQPTSSDPLAPKFPSSAFPPSAPVPPHPIPFAQRFEYPHWKRILFHILLLALAYPFLLLFVVIARNRSLFWTRAIVAIGGGVLGFVLGLSLLSLAQPHLEAATWATIAHQSQVKDTPGIRLRDFAASSQDATSAWPAFRLLWTRAMYPGTNRRRRASYDARPWSLTVVFFLLCVAVAAMLPFILGRIVDITTTTEHQRLEYEEVKVKGDLTSADIERAAALESTFNNFMITWTLAPFSTHGGLPSAVSHKWEGEEVYFSEAVTQQFVPDGAGFGTFNDDATSPSIDPLDKVTGSFSGGGISVQTGSLLRFPRWGVRIHCDKIPDLGTNMITKGNNTAGMTYLFYPIDTLQSLFDSFEMEFPSRLMQLLNVSNFLDVNDTLPIGLDITKISDVAKFYDNGVAHSMKSKPLTLNVTGYNGWVSIESVLIRMNTTYAPNGVFGAYSTQSIPDVDGNPTHIGYDAAVCLELFEPWVVETYNATLGPPTTMGIVSKGATIVDSPSLDKDAKEHRKGDSLDKSSVKTKLNVTGLNPVYDVLHGNSVNQLIKDNGRDSFYPTNPTIVSYTPGEGPTGYTELDATHFGQARALADASNILPYFVGSADTLARRYPDRVLASAYINHKYFAAMIGAVLLLGLLAGLFVPKLPYNLPHRGFDLYSWLAAFQGQELVGTYVGTNIPKNMDLRDVQAKMGDLRFTYHADTGVPPSAV